jgi:hypothetical protein
MQHTTPDESLALYSGKVVVIPLADYRLVHFIKERYLRLLHDIYSCAPRRS